MLRIGTTCSDSLPGKGAAYVRVLAGRLPLSAIRLDVSVHRDGFARSQFASFGQLSHPQSTPSSVDSTWIRERALPAYRLRAATALLPGDTGAVAFRIDGLENSVTYYWRLVNATTGRAIDTSDQAIVRVDGPSCSGPGNVARP